MSSSEQVTQLLSAWCDGDEQALSELTPIVYETLRRLSAKHVNREQNLTIQATELVHEAYLHLVSTDIDWKNRAHFFAVASRLMRRLLVDRARSRLRQKRGGGLLVSNQNIDELPEIEQTFLDLDEVLKKLAEHDSRKSEALELHYFGGMTYPEIAEALSISEATVDRDLRFAKAWVFKEINQEL